VSDPDLFKLRSGVRHGRDVATVAIEKFGNSLAEIFHRTLVWALLRRPPYLRIFGVLKRLAARSVIEAKSTLRGG
jgi:hypothetical protein